MGALGLALQWPTPLWVLLAAGKVFQQLLLATPTALAYLARSLRVVIRGILCVVCTRYVSDARACVARKAYFFC